jgi:uncharacterized iron-regulated membrane protein
LDPGFAAVHGRAELQAPGPRPGLELAQYRGLLGRAAPARHHPTGAIISYRWAGDLLFVLTGNEPPARPQEKGAREGRKPASESRASLDSLLAKATARVPSWSNISLRLPRKGGEPATASIIEPGFTRRYARSQLSLDAATADVVKWEPYAEQNLGRRLRSWIVPLHTGRAVGPPGQFLALVSAAASALLVWTGISMAWRRISKPRPRPAATAPESIRAPVRAQA